MLFKLIGIASALIFIPGDMPYLWNTFAGKTSPHRVTWGIIAILNAIGFANQYASGATNSLWLFGAGAIMTGLIFLASLRHGVGGSSITDVVCLFVGLTGIVLWIVFKSPTYSIFANIVADIAALWPTYKKANKHPETETRISWLVGTISVVLEAISVGKLDWHLLLLPVASLVLQIPIVYLLYIAAPARAHKTTELAQ
jgi:hypothetical protein